MILSYFVQLAEQRIDPPDDRQLSLYNMYYQCEAAINLPILIISVLSILLIVQVVKVVTLENKLNCRGVSPIPSR